MLMSEKVKENRLRRAAHRQGLRLEKSPRRKPDAVDFGGFMLVDVKTNTAVLGLGEFPYQARDIDVEAYLSGERTNSAAA